MLKVNPEERITARDVPHTIIFSLLNILGFWKTGLIRAKRKSMKFLWKVERELTLCNLIYLRRTNGPTKLGPSGKFWLRHLETKTLNLKLKWLLGLQKWGRRSIVIVWVKRRTRWSFWKLKRILLEVILRTKPKKNKSRLNQKLLIYWKWRWRKEIIKSQKAKGKIELSSSEEILIIFFNVQKTMYCFIKLNRIHNTPDWLKVFYGSMYLTPLKWNLLILSVLWIMFIILKIKNGTNQRRYKFLFRKSKSFKST